MNLTSRMKFALLQRCIMNTVFLLMLLSLLFLYLYPEIQKFEALKKELHEDFDYYTEIQKNGINLQTLVSRLRSSWQLQDSYLRNVFTQITPQFYQTHFKNTQAQNFELFIEEKSQEIEAIKLTQDYQERYKLIDTILPVFSSGIRIAENDLSNAEFINYVENLLYSFNLTHRGEIGIQSLNLVEGGKNISPEQENNLTENIFKIPLEFTVEWMKGNIVNFLHYLSHVWSVSADLQNDTLLPYNDSFLGWSWESQLFSNSRYLGQLVTIDAIHFDESLDSSVTQSSEEFISRLRSPGQFRERYKVRMTLDFYVAGYPQYRINQAIDELKESLESSLTEMDEGLKKAAEAFDQTKNEKASEHRILARSVNRLKENFTELQSANIVTLGQNEVIELYNDLIQLKTLEGITRENYTNFMR